MFRCPWCESNPLLLSYHDTEWGARPCTEEKHFEFLMLESAQAGLSFLTVLKRREAYRAAYAGFDAFVVAGWDEAMVDTLMQAPLLIHNRPKILASLKNARAFVNIQREFSSFDAYLLSFFGGKPQVNSRAGEDAIPAVTEAANLISADMKKRGFSFMGPTVMYAHLQAAGIVDDHVDGCFCKAAQSLAGPDLHKWAVLAKVGSALKEENILFGVGGSAMLYQFALAEDFHDIDLIVALQDARRAEEVLLRLGQACPVKSSGAFVTDVFRSFLVDGIGVDMMAGLAIRHGTGVYRYPFDESSLPRAFPVMGRMLPFCTPEEWCLLYGLMPGKQEKAERIFDSLIAHGVRCPALVRKMLDAGAPQEMALRGRQLLQVVGEVMNS